MEEKLEEKLLKLWPQLSATEIHLSLQTNFSVQPSVCAVVVRTVFLWNEGLLLVCFLLQIKCSTILLICWLLYSLSNHPTARVYCHVGACCQLPDLRNCFWRSVDWMLSQPIFKTVSQEYKNITRSYHNPELYMSITLPWCWPYPQCTGLPLYTPWHWSHHGPKPWPVHCLKPPGWHRQWCCTAGSWSDGWGGHTRTEKHTWKGNL